MRILVDPSIFQYGRCGMTRYYAAVCNGLAAEGASVRVPLVTSGCDFDSSASYYTRWLRKMPRGAAVMDTLSKAWFHWLVCRGKYDLVLVTSPAFDASFLRKRPSCRFVMIVHDLMSCVTAPDGLYDAAGPGLTALLYLARRAVCVICISEDTRIALLSQELNEPSRVKVVRSGNLLAATAPSQSEVDLPDRFLLFVGERSGRKGFYTFLRAAAPVLLEDSSLQIICTGTFRESELDFIDAHGLTGRVCSVAAADETLVALYRRALCLAYPSLYEGFGLPVLEAMYYGCPVITTQCGALKEIGGDAVRYVDATDADSITRAVRELVTQPSIRQELAERGRTRSLKFGASEMMQQLFATLKRNCE